MSAAVAEEKQMMQASGAGFSLFPEGSLRYLPLAACVCDSAGRIVDFNAKAAALWGREPVASDTWASIAQDSPSSHQFEAAVSRGEPQTNVALSVVRPGQPRVFLLASTEPVWDGDTLAGTVITFQRHIDAAGGGQGLLWETLEALPTAVYTADAEGRITFYNTAAAELWGARPEIGGTLWCGAAKLYRSDGSLMPHDECPMAITIRERRPVRGVEAMLERPDGSRVAVLPHPTPLYDGAGTFVGAINMLLDVTHNKVAEERHLLFSRELNHRVKNALATVYAIAMQTLRYTDSIDSFRESFSSRLLALSRAHDLLVRSQWQETPLKTIVSEALSSFGAGRLDVDGDDAAFGPRATLTLAMTIHELVTNAMRFGALSNAEGHVTVSWNVALDEDGDPVVALTWRENGGPAIEKAAEPAFGSRLISHNLMALGGSVQSDYRREGLCCEMRFPVINEAPGWPVASASRPSDATAGRASPGEPVR